ncbi:hypothetical protein [Fusobacterium sp. MFO224]|uniref:hypothetical protein n=1 Tax=Fusobacterium sp. MFO224 TaxID=3378070 RepID=UPI003853C298
MIDFNKLDEYIELIEEGNVPEEMTFNEFAMDFYKEAKIIPLSKYLRNKNKYKKLPKIMNMKKAGEILTDTYKDSSGEVTTFLKRKGYREIPQLNFTIITLVRKVDLISNWKRLISYLGGDKTIEEINNSTKVQLFPEEIKKLEEFIKEELKIDDDDLNWLLTKFKKIDNNRHLLRAIRKLNRQ